MNKPSSPVQRQIARFYPLWMMLGFALLLGVTRLGETYPIPWPRCGLKTLTGIPCPFCGSTRCLAAWSHLDAARAFAWNPLVAGASLALVAWFALWAVGLRRQTWPLRTRAIFRSKGALTLGAILLAANWVYLILTLP